MGCGCGPSKKPPTDLGIFQQILDLLAFKKITVNLKSVTIEFDINSGQGWKCGDNQKLFAKFSAKKKEYEAKEEELLKLEIDFQASALVV